jgi:hypothetical protein
MECKTRGRPWPREWEGPAACGGRDGAKRKVFQGIPTSRLYHLLQVTEFTEFFAGQFQVFLEI